MLLWSGSMKEYCTVLDNFERIILENHALCHYNGKGRDVLDGYSSFSCVSITIKNVAFISFLGEIYCLVK